MREIKFRAWDKERKKILYVFHWHKGDTVDLITTLDGFNKSRLLFIGEGVDLMQYTGLKDKNGMEVYEGDILANDNILGVVAYNQTPDCIYAGSYMIQDKDSYATDWDGVEPENWHFYEVIGNIYENPELLKD